MKAWIWLRVLAILLGFFAFGHTLGTAAPRVTHGPQEAALFAEMQSFHFPIMGFNRSYWDFYRGFALTISLLLVVLTAMAWQLSALSRHDPNRALPMAVSLLFVCLGMTVLSLMFFFGGPILFSALSVICSIIAVRLLRRESAGA